MNAVVDIKETELPAPVSRRGISEAQWRTAMNNLFPGARRESVLMVFDYCAARRLDPLKKPCHIVPMEVKNVATDKWEWRDVVMPGIYEYRTTAQRTGEYLGHSIPEYGPSEEYKGVMAPAWCAITVYRWNLAAKIRAEYPVKVLFKEIVATKKSGEVNARWTKAPQQMLTKCAEAAALREAFPDELGGEHTAEEMEGQNQTESGDIIQIPLVTGVDPRGDVSGVDWELRDKHVSAITDLLNLDKEETEIAQLLRDYEAEYLQPFAALYSTVLDKLASEKIIAKGKFKEYLRIGVDRK